jgi:putative transposase
MHTVGAVFGDDTFKQWVYDELLPELEAEGKTRVIRPNVSIDDVVNKVAVFYNLSSAIITTNIRGLQPENEPRKVAIHLCQALTRARMIEIAQHFNLYDYSSVSHAAHQVRTQNGTKSHLRQNWKCWLKP